MEQISGSYCENCRKKIHIKLFSQNTVRTSQVVPVIQNPPANAGDKRDAGSIPGLGKCPEGGHGNPLQYSCLENPMDRGAQ